MTNRRDGLGWDTAADPPQGTRDLGESASISHRVSRSQKRDSCLGFLGVSVKGEVQPNLASHPLPASPRTLCLYLDIKGREGERPGLGSSLLHVHPFLQVRASESAHLTLNLDCTAY